MNKILKRKIQEKKVKLAPIDEETAKKIERLSEKTGSDAEKIIHVAIEILEQTFGRELVVKGTAEENQDLIINYFKKYSKLVKLSEK